MKNRNSSTPHKLSPKYSDSDLKRTYEKVKKTKSSNSNTFLQKGARILQNYSTFLTKSLYQGGDPELYFKQTLRNYDDLDFGSVRNDPHSSFNQTLNHIKSSDSIKPERRKSASYVGSGDNKDKFRGSARTARSSRPLSSSKVTQRTHRTEEDDSEVFYSPASLITSRSAFGKLKMAEEEITTGEETGAEEEGEDPLRETEELMKEAEEDLDKMDEVLQEGEEAAKPEATAGQEGEEAGKEQPPGDKPPGDKPPEDKPPGDKPPGDKPPGDKPAGGPPAPEEPPKEMDDKGILKEVAECEAQCTEISKILVQLKQRVTTLLSKPSRSPEEDRELDRNQKELNEKMMLLEQKTKKVEYLMTLSRKRAKYDQPQTEDILPKVILCGTTDLNMPKIIVCDDKKRKKRDKLMQPLMQQPLDQECICHDPNTVNVTGPPGRAGVGAVCVPPQYMDRPGGALSQQPQYMDRPGGMRPDRGMAGPTGPGGPVCPGPQVCPVSIGTMPQQPGIMPTTFAQRLCESYNMQEKLAAENADLEGKRYQLQSDLLNKDQTVESLQRKLATLQAEMRMVLKENTILNDKLERAKAPKDGKGDTSRPGSRGRKMPCGRGRPCPNDPKRDEYAETTQQLEKQLNDMEEEVRKMQSELLAVRQERIHLEQHRRMLSGPPPQPMPPAPRPPMMDPAMKSTCAGPCNPNRPSGISADQQLRELREQYNTLQDDYKGKLIEVSGLRADVDKLKQTANENEEARKLSEKKMKEMEKELKELKGLRKGPGGTEGITELEQQLSIAKQRYREVKDELEEVRALVEEQKSQLDDYRNKYLQAQQQVEEQRRQIDMMELENGRISEQVNLEIQRVKNQFQEKLQELTPLPDILKATQLKLQEAQQMHLLAERNNEALVRELQAYRDKAAAMAKEMDTAKSMASLGEDEKMTMQARIEELLAKCNELTEEMERNKAEMMQLKEVADEAEKLAKEKMHQIAQLSAEVDNVREEAARQVARTKDRCETVRRSMQNQISDMERQLAQSRAQARAAQKDRDEIRQKMQAQINNLNENFEDAQMRIRNLQGHVNFLKTSYTNVFPNDGKSYHTEGKPNDQLEPCNCGNAKF